MGLEDGQDYKITNKNLRWVTGVQLEEPRSSALGTGRVSIYPACSFSHMMSRTTQIKIRKPYQQRRKMDALSDSAQAEIRNWFIVEDASYHVVQRRAQERFGIRLSLTGLCEYWQREIAPELVRREAAKLGFDVEIVIRQSGRVVATKIVNVPLA